MTQLVKIAGVEMRYVKELPEDHIELLAKVVEAFRSNAGMGFGQFDSVEKILGGELASGHFGVVYNFGEDYILKIEKPWTKGEYNTRDGLVLEQLQGIGIIPQIYIYDLDNNFMVIQKVKGQMCATYAKTPEFDLPSNFDIQWTKEFIKRSAQEIEERGWVIGDAHAGNCMIDQEGNFYIVDVGLFDNIEEIQEGIRPFGRSTDEAVLSLSLAYQGHHLYRKRKATQEKLKKINAMAQEVAVKDVQNLQEAVAGLAHGFAGLGNALENVRGNLAPQWEPMPEHKYFF